MFYAVVRGSIKFEDVERTLFVECLTTLTLSTSLTISGGRHTVDGLGKDACTGGLTHTTRSAEEVGMCQFSALHGILQGGGQRLLSYHCVEGGRAIFTGRNNIFHTFLKIMVQRYDKKVKK